MAKLETYQNNYRFIKLERDNGVLELTIHKDGGSAQWSAFPGGLHDELGRSFYEIGRDPENRVVIITGAGDDFLTEIDWSEEDPDFGKPEFWDRLYKEGKDLLMNLLDIDVPVIGAVNGPAFIHAEIPTMSDIVIASDTAVFADKAHVPSYTVPGDGVHIWWQMLLGPNRGRHFLLTAAEIDAKEAKELGVVAEVVPQDQVLPRARELAKQVAQLPIGVLRGTRMSFVQHIKRRMIDDLGFGLQAEGMGVLALIQANQGKPMT